MIDESGPEKLRSLGSILEEWTDDLDISIRSMRAARDQEDNSGADPALKELRDAVKPYLMTDKNSTLTTMNAWLKKLEPKAMFTVDDDGELTLDLLGASIG